MSGMTLLVAAVIGTLAVARVTRLLVADAYPPAHKLRLWWWNQTIAKGGWRKGWAPLLTSEDNIDAGCPFCAAPYLTLISLVWFLWSGADAGWGFPTDGLSWASAWWFLSTWCALSYVASMVVVRDEPPAEEE